ncbi:MAG: hydrolase [Hydrocarboniphaga sp.]|uniref:NUDIX hydrolase n=1 Tax=Hydrocarboniphaga sp. TaxID=2033016 RepID=UPI00262FB393|nr:NUDIX hydrolase [Hydrocarboniphaga sp.]MDB5968488.1 hydrolase [Hydrocarboniphaga sp.]
MSSAGYCTVCGTMLQLRRPDNDTRDRLICPGCGFIHYENPKILVGCSVTSRQRILLCQRAIEPSRGLWSPPSGFLECDESLEAGAAREVFEETGVVIDPELLVPHIITSLLDIKQVYVSFRVDIDDCIVTPGHEALNAAFFSESEVPWEQLAFPGMREYLKLMFNEHADERYSLHVSRIADAASTRRGFHLLTDRYQRHLLK